MWAADGSGELHLPSYDLFSSTEVLGQIALERMLAGLSSRRYAAGLEPAGPAVGDAVRLGVLPTLARTLRSTNTIESMIGICREHSKNVKRWRDGQMALRWCAAGMTEAREAVPARQRPPAPAQAPRRAHRVLHRECHCRMPG